MLDKLLAGRKKSEQLMIVLIGVLGIGYGSWTYLLEPTFTKNSTLKVEAATLRDKVSLLDSYKAQADQLKQEIEASKKPGDISQVDLKEDLQNSSLITEIGRTASDSGVNLNRIDISRPLQNGLWWEYPFSLTVQGDYQELLIFSKKMEALRKSYTLRYINIKHIKVDASTGIASGGGGSSKGASPSGDAEEASPELGEEFDLSWAEGSTTVTDEHAPIIGKEDLESDTVDSLQLDFTIVFLSKYAPEAEKGTPSPPQGDPNSPTEPQQGGGNVLTDPSQLISNQPPSQPQGKSNPFMTNIVIPPEEKETPSTESTSTPDLPKEESPKTNEPFDLDQILNENQTQNDSGKVQTNNEILPTYPSTYYADDIDPESARYRDLVEKVKTNASFRNVELARITAAIANRKRDGLATTSLDEYKKLIESVN